MTVIALLTLCEYIFGWNLGIDEAIFRDFTSRPGMPAGRMALSTACSLALLGPALVLFHIGRARRAIQALVFAAGRNRIPQLCRLFVRKSRFIQTGTV